MKSEKIAICNSFAKAAAQYESVATIQQQVANDHASFIFDFISPQLPRTCIDLGCGTGFLSQALRSRYSNLRITLNDLAPEMIEKAASALFLSESADFIKGDIEGVETERSWDLAASSFAWQWLEAPEKALRTWMNRSQTVALSLPIEGTFQEWEGLHASLSLSSRLRKLPSMEEVLFWAKSTGPSHFEIQEKSYTQLIRSPLDFARQLKAMGAALPRSQMIAPSLKRVQRFNSAPFTVTWKVAFLACHSSSPQLGSNDYEFKNS